MRMGPDKDPREEEVQTPLSFLTRYDSRFKTRNSY
jgi:hypothetical protein